MSREELKVSIIIKGDRIFLGAQATDCDPKMTTLQGNLQTALERIPSFIEEANRQWDASPHNPRSTVPEQRSSASEDSDDSGKQAGCRKARPTGTTELLLTCAKTQTALNTRLRPGIRRRKFVTKRR